MEKGGTSVLAKACEALTIVDDDDNVIIEEEDIHNPSFDF